MNDIQVNDTINSKLNFHVSKRPKWKVLEIRTNRKGALRYWCKSLHESKAGTGFDNVYYEFNSKEITL